jgi:hypothetical protein
MGSVISGPVKDDGTWDLWASFPSNAGRKNGRIAVSKDNGRTWRIVKVIHGPFAYSALQVSPDRSSLLCLYESNGYRTQSLLKIPFSAFGAFDPQPAAKTGIQPPESRSSPVFPADDFGAGAPEIIKVMDLDGLSVAGKPGVEKSYRYFREPNAVVTREGTLIVVAGPHHVRGKNDRAHQDALCRTSRDGGKTWSDITMIADAGMDSIVPAVLVYDEQRNRVLFVYNVIFNDPDRDQSEKRHSQQFVIHSDDAGASWSESREILKELTGICVFGGGNGFQLKHGKKKGRLLIPGGHRSSGFRRGYFFSDDHGKTWSFQKIKLDGRQEATGCEVDDGTIMLNHRQSGYGMAVTSSRDGGATWSKQRRMLPDAWSACNNSALSVHDARGGQYVLIGTPLGPENADRYVIEQDAAKLKRGVEDSKQAGRSNGAVFLSRDGGKTWPIGVCVAPGWTFGYNALISLPNGEIGLVFEGSPSGVDWSKVKRDHNTGARLGIYMVRFSLDWLLAQKKAALKGGMVVRSACRIYAVTHHGNGCETVNDLDLTWRDQSL